MAKRTYREKEDARKRYVTFLRELADEIEARRITPRDGRIEMNIGGALGVLEHHKLWIEWYTKRPKVMKPMPPDFGLLGAVRGTAPDVRSNVFSTLDSVTIPVKKQ